MDHRRHPVPAPDGVVAVIATFTYRRTGSVCLGAFICALFVTWYIVAGQAIQAVL